MSKSTLCTIFAFFPFLALAGSIGLLERVPNLPTSAEAALSGRTELAAKVNALRADGINVVEQRSLIVKASPYNKRYLDTKKERMAHML